MASADEIRAEGQGHPGFHVQSTVSADRRLGSCDEANDVRSLVAVAALHIHYVFLMRSDDTNLEIIPALTVESVQLGYALVSATIPNLKSFIMSFDTAMMMDLHGYRSESHSQQTKSRSTFGWRSRHSSNQVSRRLQYSDASTQDELIGRLRPERLEHRTDAHCVDDIEAEIENMPTREERESQDRSIRRDLQWKVEEEFHLPVDSPHSITKPLSPH